jgi:hypothetical protein
MADIVLSTVDLDVFGGPSTLDVSVDFGQTGDRGSRFWAGPGDPNTFLVGQDVRLYDLFLDYSTSIIYQYLEQVGNPEWTTLTSITIPQYSVIASENFSTGSTTGTVAVSIPISAITLDAGTSVSDFVIRYNIEGDNPIATNFSYVISGANLVITIEAIEYVSSSWSSLSGAHDIHLFVSYVG